MIAVVIVFLTLSNVQQAALIVYVLRCVSRMTQTLEQMGARLDEISARP